MGQFNHYKTDLDQELTADRVNRQMYLFQYTVRFTRDRLERCRVTDTIIWASPML